MNMQERQLLNLVEQTSSQLVTKAALGTVVDCWEFVGLQVPRACFYPSGIDFTDFEREREMVVSEPLVL